jgi:hypothetical protein
MNVFTKQILRVLQGLDRGSRELPWRKRRGKRWRCRRVTYQAIGPVIRLLLLPLIAVVPVERRRRLERPDPLWTNLEGAGSFLLQVPVPARQAPGGWNDTRVGRGLAAGDGVGRCVSDLFVLRIYTHPSLNRQGLFVACTHAALSRLTPRLAYPCLDSVAMAAAVLARLGLGVPTFPTAHSS